MNFAGLIFLIAAHFLTGRGILKLFRQELPLLPTVCLSFIIGVPPLAFIPCILQLMNIPITIDSVSIGIGTLAAIMTAPLFFDISRPKIGKIELPRLYEIPFMLIFLYFIVISVWRCFYMPPYSRDMLTGPELIAEYTVREHTLINSVFNVDLTTTNNHLKSPFVTCLQVIYKLLVCPFGQMWLSVLFVSFVIWLYSIVRQRVHPLIAGLLMVLFMAIPEVFAYSFVLLYDYSNMVLFFAAFFFFIRYLQNDKINDFALSAFIFGLATFIRTESLILVAMLSTLLMIIQFKKKVPIPKILGRVALLGTVPFIFYYIVINVFVKKFVPFKWDVSVEINQNLSDVSVLFQRLSDMVNLLIYSEAGTEFYGWFIFIFTAVLLVDIVWPRKFNKEAAFSLFGIGVIYFGLGFIGFLLPLADLSNTTKRGMFKALPMMLLYMANSGILQRISTALTNWELNIKPEPKPEAQVSRPPVQRVVRQQKPRR